MSGPKFAVTSNDVGILVYHTRLARVTQGRLYQTIDDV